jgi:Type II secretion system (T2SS), protein E, N-terminal domain
LHNDIRAHLHSYFPRSTPLSLLLLHISQLEHIHIAPQTAVLHKRQRLHAPASFLEQVLVNVRRAIRSSDQLLIHEGTGAALVLPAVDQAGMYSILERVYQSVSLLQSETVIPPLKRETDIVIGIGSYPEPSISLEMLLCHTGNTARRLTLRPAIMAHIWSGEDTTPIAMQPLEHFVEQAEQVSENKVHSNVPFMQLPAKLPSRLKNLIPYSTALELHCAPVGRDHHYLTVAMEDPTNRETLQRLRAITGMTIFPVTCEIVALHALLAEKW